jgi:hypothetical protein
MRRAFLIWIVAFSLALVGCSSKSQPSPFVERAMWYWHTPFNLDKQAAGALADMHVTRLFVRTGTLSTDGQDITVTVPQRFETAAPCPVHLVFNADSGVLKHFDEAVKNGLSQKLLKFYSAAKAAANKAGLKVRGLQVDFDVPTRLLDKYAQVMRELRVGLPNNEELSLTGLPTYLATEGFKDVVDQVDFFAPQFYEGSIGTDLAHLRSISAKESIDRGIELAERFQKPYYLGLPAYGQALIFDEKGKIAGAYRKLSPVDALRHPSFTFKSFALSEGEEILQLVANQNGVNGKGKGYTLVYRRVTPLLVAQMQSDAVHHRSTYCRGLSWFRVAEKGECLAMNLTTLRAALDGREPQLDFDLKSSEEVEPFAKIEGGGELGSRVSFSLFSRGEAETAIQPSALTLTVRFPEGTLDSVEPGEFANVQPFYDDPKSSGQVSLARSNGVQFNLPYLGPGQKVSTGALRFRGPVRLSVHWSAATPQKRVEGDKLEIKTGESTKTP